MLKKKAGIKSERMAGMWEFNSTDILPETIVLGFLESPVPMEVRYSAILCNSIKDAADKCGTILIDFIGCDAIDKGSYIDYITEKFSPKSEDEDEILEEWIEFQDERFEELDKRTKRITDKTLNELRQIIEDYNLSTELKECMFMKDWLGMEDTQGYLLCFCALLIV